MLHLKKPKPKAKPAAKKAAAKPAPKKPTQAKPKAAAGAGKKRAMPESEDEDQPSFLDSSPGNLADTPPEPKKQKKAPVKKSNGVPLADLENEISGVDGTDDPKPTNKKGQPKYEMVSAIFM
jgi:DNA topoisomerase II